MRQRISPWTAGLLSLALAAGCHKGGEAMNASADSAARPPCPCHSMHAIGDAGTSDMPPCHAHGTQGIPALQPVPGQSLYQLTSTWQNQNGETVPVSLYRGQPTLVLMFYGTCQAACPLLVGDLKRIDEALPESVRGRTRYLLVTFDPQNDTTERLRTLATERGLDTSRFTLLRGTDDDVRELATVLGVQYRPMGNGQFSHSNVITLLDANGVVAFQLEGLRQPVETMVQHVSEVSGIETH